MSNANDDSQLRKARPAIETAGLRKVYPPPPQARREKSAEGSGVIAVDSLDLSIPVGEFFGLLGPNGAGKTTTIGILTTRVRPTEGRAMVAGWDVTADESKVRREIGVVPQRPNPDRSLNVIENLVFHASYFGVPWKEAVARANELLERFGIGPKAKAKVDQLSGGQQQRVMIARALIHEPRILFLDEPTLGLDPQGRLAIWDILRELRRKGTTIVMTTHYMEEADQLCDRVAILDRGRLLALDTPEKLKAQAPGGTLIELTVEGSVAGLAGRVKEITGIVRVEHDTSILRAYSDRGGEVVSPLIAAAETHGCQVKDIRLVPPSLETLFISLTGRTLD